jgi:hypothetical protein
MNDEDDRDRAREPLVRVAVAENDFDAQLIHDELADAGIRSLVRSDDVLTSARAIGFAAPFSREIFVLEGDLARAREVLGDRANG